MFDFLNLILIKAEQTNNFFNVTYYYDKPQANI